MQSAQVSRDWPDAVVITITGRTPALAVASGGGFALVDRFGVVVEPRGQRPAGMVLLARHRPAASLRGSPAVRAAVTVLQAASGADPAPGAVGGRAVARTR